MREIKSKNSVTNRVSVIIPCYNKEEYIGKAIESATSQSYEDVEVVVINDGSTDRSLEVIQKYESDGIIWRTQKNKGAPVARNRGLSLSTGEFIKFLDADDVLVEGVLEKQVDQMRNVCSHNEIVFGNLATIDGDGKIIDHLTYDRLEYGECASLEDVLKENICTSCPLHRKKHLLEIGGFDEGVTKLQEYYVHIQLILRGVKLKYEDCLCYYNRRRIEGRITSKNHLKKDPLYEYRDKVNQIASMRRMIGGEIPGSVRQHFARDLWRKGRRLLRLGYDEEARTYFEEARSLDSSAFVVGSFVYRLLTKLLGPLTAERVGALKRRLNPFNSQS
jgi:glycosyltransferase involved in cell wall biosynthesis